MTMPRLPEGDPCYHDFNVREQLEDTDTSEHNLQDKGIVFRGAFSTRVSYPTHDAEMAFSDDIENSLADAWDRFFATQPRIGTATPEEIQRIDQAFEKMDRDMDAQSMNAASNRGIMAMEENIANGGEIRFPEQGIILDESRKKQE